MSNDNSGLELTRRRILGGITTAGVAAAGAGAGTMALFQDTESSNGNTVQMGTLDLKLGDTDEGYGDGVSGEFSADDFKPGDKLHGTVDARNDGSLEADHLEIEIEASGTEADGNGSDDGDTMPKSATGMPSVFEVTTLSYPKQGDNAGGELLENVDDVNNNGITDLDDVMQYGVLDELKPAPKPSKKRSFTMDLEFVDTGRADYIGSYDDDDFQGDELSITVTMGLAQESGQDVL